MEVFGRETEIGQRGVGGRLGQSKGEEGHSRERKANRQRAWSRLYWAKGVGRQKGRPGWRNWGAVCHTRIPDVTWKA